MGFDVLYFPPIHPIGGTNRKVAIMRSLVNRRSGSAMGDWRRGRGHKAVTFVRHARDFDWLQKEVRKRGLEIALDFAINCSRDHP